MLLCSHAGYMQPSFFFFNDTATTEIYTLSLHDALPISRSIRLGPLGAEAPDQPGRRGTDGDRKSTRLNSSHQIISYAVFCLKKKRKGERTIGCSSGAPRDTLT